MDQPELAARLHEVQFSAIDKVGEIPVDIDLYGPRSVHRQGVGARRLFQSLSDRRTASVEALYVEAEPPGSFGCSHQCG